MSILLPWAASSAGLILIVLAVRRLGRRRLSARVRYALWLVVLVRLLLPVQFAVPALPAVSDTPAAQSAGTALRQRTIPVLPQRYTLEEVQAGQAPTLHAAQDGTVASDAGIGAVRSDPEREEVVYAPLWLSPRQVLLAVYCAGLAAALLVLAGSNLRFARNLRRSRRGLFVQNAKIPVYITSGISSPCLFGPVSPAVYLTPEAAEDSAARGHILAHELTHYAHKDHIWSALRCLALALHWYNPLVWLAVLRSKEDGELACDEGAVARLGEAERIPYGRTLVDMVARRSLRPGDLFSCSTAMTGGKGALRRRVEALVKRPQTAKAALFVSASVLALAAVLAFTGGTAQNNRLGYDEFLSMIRSAQTIRYEPPLSSSTAYPDAIADEDLLEQAKACLLDNVHEFLGVDDENRWPQEILHASTLTLSDTGREEDGASFLLCPWDGTLYVLQPADWTADAYTALFTFPGDSGVEETLEALSREQYERNEQGAAEETSNLIISALQKGEYDRIRFDGGPRSGYLGPEITDADLLAEAASVLTSGDLRSDTVEADSRYTGAAVSVSRGSDGLLADCSVTDEAMCQALEELVRQQDARDQTYGTRLTQAEIDWFNTEFFNGDNGNFRNQFLTSLYGRPEDIDLYQLFYLGGSTHFNTGSPMTDVEYQQVLNQGYGGNDPDCDCTKTTAAEMDADLLQYAGVSLSDSSQNGLDELTYLSDYHAYYHFHGDTNYTGVSVLGGTRRNGRVTLYCDNGYDRLQAVTLAEAGSGYRFVSNQRLDTLASVSLTEQELDEFRTSFFGQSGGFNLRLHFLTSFYETPRDIDLFALFYDGAGTGAQSFSQEELAELERAGNADWQNAQLFRVRATDIQAALEKYAGLSLEETFQINLDQFTYLPDYDAYYTAHGDTNLPAVTFLRGVRSGGTVTLYYQFGSQEDTRAVTLLRTEEGQYQFLSNLPLSQEGGTAQAER